MKKLGVRDLVNAGLFSVLMIAATFVAGMIGFIPVLMPAIPFVTTILTGTIYMLYTTKIRSFGMLMIMGVVFAIVFAMSGHGVFVYPGILLASLLAEFVLRMGGYKSLKYARLSYVAFSLYSAALLLPLFVSRDEYVQLLIENGYGENYAQTVISVLPMWSFIPVVLTGCIGAYIGCTIGIKVLKKHFEKAGMI